MPVLGRPRIPPTGFKSLEQPALNHVEFSLEFLDILHLVFELRCAIIQINKDIGFKNEE